ncbi:MAG: MFS transporter [Egibacteraceae bacterium]
MNRLTVTGAGLIAVTYGLARFGLGLFMPEMREVFGLSATGAGWVMAAAFAGFFAALARAGDLIDRRGAREVAVAAGAAAALGTLTIALAQGPVLLAVGAALAGASTGWSTTALATAVERQLLARERTTAQTAINAGTSLGLVVAALAATLAGLAWRPVWLAFGVLAVAATALVAGEVRDVPAPAATTTTDEGAARRPRLGLSTPLAATAILLGLSSAAFWGFGRELLEATGGLSPELSRMGWLAAGIGGVLGGAAGAAADRRGLAATLRLSWVGFALAHVGLAVGGVGAASALGLTALFGAGYMALTGLLIVWSVTERPLEPGTAVARTFLLLAAGQIAGSPMAGGLIDAAGLAPAFLASAALATLGLAALPGAEALSPRRAAAAARGHRPGGRGPWRRPRRRTRPLQAG